MSHLHSTPDSYLEIAPPSALELIWINHRGSLLGGIFTFLLLALIAISVMVSMRATRLASEAMLSEAKGAEGWRNVIAKYPRTPAGADAMLLLAASLRQEGRFQESDDLYSRFAESFPNSTLLISGLLGRAANARASNHPDIAISSYQQAAAAFSQSYGASFALFSELQLLTQQGKSDEAKKVLQSLISQYPTSASAQRFSGAPRDSAER
jgi:tetratricopeptide (TPR) repeat protein